MEVLLSDKRLGLIMALSYPLKAKYISKRLWVKENPKLYQMIFVSIQQKAEAAAISKI
jgi:hypothetical protein